jgi:NhaA family Na+:H+ antiporter
VLISLLIGKTAGIFSFGLLATKLGFKLPHGMKRRDLLTAGLIAGTGFTVALFVAGEAFTDPTIRSAAKMGAMFSLIAAICGLFVGKMVGVIKKP